MAMIRFLDFGQSVREWAESGWGMPRPKEGGERRADRTSSFRRVRRVIESPDPLTLTSAASIPRFGWSMFPHLSSSHVQLNFLLVHPIETGQPAAGLAEDRFSTHTHPRRHS
jgi:hypothetical protein